MAVELGIDDNLHQQLLALEVLIQQTEKTSCAPYDVIISASNITNVDGIWPKRTIPMA